MHTHRDFNVDKLSMSVEYFSTQKYTPVQVLTTFKYTKYLILNEPGNISLIHRLSDF